MPNIDTKKIEELRSLLAKATLGPWSATEKDGRFLFKIMSSSVYVAETSWHDASPIFPTKEGSKANFDLIVAMRNAMPALLDLASLFLASANGREDAMPPNNALSREWLEYMARAEEGHEVNAGVGLYVPPSNVGASGGEDVELCERLKVYSLAEDIMSSERRDLTEATARILSLSAQLAEAQRERDRLQDVIERDRTKAAEIIGEIRGAVEPYRWLGEGRGSYAWDDDRYQMEFSNCMAALYAALDPLRCLASDWSDCPKDFQGARIDWKARATAAETRSAKLARALDREIAHADELRQSATSATMREAWDVAYTSLRRARYAEALECSMKDLVP